MNMDNENNNSSSNIKDDIDFMANASMTESYSEILDSPTADSNIGHGVESNTPIKITKRKTTPLSRHQSSQCKIFLCLLNLLL